MRSRLFTDIVIILPHIMYCGFKVIILLSYFNRCVLIFAITEIGGGAEISDKLCISKYLKDVSQIEEKITKILKYVLPLF